MKVTLERRYPVPAPADVAWTLLCQLEALAACMPGAKITERIDERRFRGTVTVRIGPASMVFRGEIEVQQIDAPERSLRMLGKGTDTTGSSAAAMDLRARIEAADGAACILAGACEVSMSGKAAAFGARVMNTVAEQVLQQFADNFAARAAALASGGGRPGALDGSGAATAPEPATDAGKQAQTASAPSELNGLALLWAVLKQWLRALVGKGAA
jgi:uncharacterized protein